MPPMLMTPMMPRKANQTSMTGPKAFPMMLVPIRWMEKSTSKMTMVMIKTVVWLLTGTLPLPNSSPFNPSIAVVTVTAGVRVPSARIAAPPIRAGQISQAALFLTKV